MLTPVELPGRVVRLEPLTADHVEGLAAAAAEDRASYAFTRVPDGREQTAAYVALALDEQAAGTALPWAVRRLADGRLVGSTRYLDVERIAGRLVLEVGSTWYAASAQRTAVNTECKLLLLTHAFEQLEAVRVSFRTDARNARSRAAIARLGARPEGVRRAHQLGSDGTLRDTAYASVLREEWPQVRAGLQARLER